MFLEKLKLQLFAANEIDDPDNGEQDDEVVDDFVDDDNIDEEVDEETDDDAVDDEGEEDNQDGEEELDEESEEDKPFMVFKSKDEHQKYMDNVIGKRLGETRKKQEEQESVISVLQQYFEVNDFDSLKKKSEELLDDIAYKKGISKDDLLRQQKDQKELRDLRAMQEQQRQQAFFNAFSSDCENLSKSNPELYGDIKVDELIKDDDFLRMLGQGIPFKKAYDALHVDELIKKQTTKAKKNVIDNVKAKGSRIKEGAATKTKAASIKLDPSKMTDEQLADLEERAARGEKITF